MEKFALDKKMNVRARKMLWLSLAVGECRLVGKVEVGKKFSEPFNVLHPVFSSSESRRTF